MIHSPGERDPVELLADEFVSRCRRGESPSVAEYAAKYPQYAGQIEELFPAVAVMEQLRTAEKAKREAALRGARFAAPPEHIGDFDIVQEIGRGGMGIVYEAEQRSLARRVAVKVLPKHVLLLDKHLKRFQCEAQTAAKLRHTNIVPVFGVGDQDGLHYYVMPLVRGVGLDEIIRELRGGGEVSTADSPPRRAPGSPARDIHGIVRALTARKFETTPSAPRETQPGSCGDSPVSADTRHSSRSSTGRLARSSGAEANEANHGRHRAGRCRPAEVHRSVRSGHWRMVARIGVQAAEALDYAHAQGTLHRDVKPSNLLVDEAGVVCVADFGLARAVEHTGSSRSGEVVGTLRYMAPEQFEGAADVRSDVYALGMTLYELLTLRSAFEDSDLRRRLDGRQVVPGPVRPRKIDQAIPRDLETIVLKCLAHEPSKRYQTAAALAADLRRFLEDKPIRARRASSIERAWRWCRRNPALSATSTLAALLLVAVAATALAGHLQTRKAYVGTRKALMQAEATSQLALEVLDDIYLQLSPDRIWVLSDADRGGEVCVCLGLRSSAGSASSAGRAAMQVQASEETASLLKGLLVFYDRLAEQAGNDSPVMLQSAIASRRVGDIRQRLGQLDEAEEEYARAIEKLTALSARPNADAEICIELARSYNELGNVRSARFELGPAYESHRKAISILQAFEPTGKLPAEYRYELARTLYLLAKRYTVELGNRRGRDPAENAAVSGPRPYNRRECRESAIRILEQLTRENPNIPDYQFLLALCYRPLRFGLTPAGSSGSAQGRQQAIRILEELKTRYPEVADYRYELTVTYAWVHVGLLSWQGPMAVPSDAEQSLLKALDESRWLVAHNPSIPLYARSETLILAKLGTICWKTKRLAEAEDYFRKALETQSGLIAKFSDLPSHNRILLEFVRLRLTQVCLERDGNSRDLNAAGKSRELLQRSVENLTELTTRPELAEDRLAWSSLGIAYDALSRVFAETGENEKAEEAKRSGKAIRSKMPEGRRDPWQE